MNRSNLIFLLVTAILMSVLFALAVDVEDAPPAPPAQTSAIGAPGAAARDLVFRQYDPQDVDVQYDQFGQAVPFAPGENFISADRPLKHETFRIELGLDASVEYKAEMNGGDVLVYQWRVVEGEVYYDFHGHPHMEETEFFNRYAEGEGSSGSGAIIAGFTGQHGWFWLNISDGPVVVELDVSGFHDRVVEIETY